MKPLHLTGLALLAALILCPAPSLFAQSQLKDADRASVQFEVDVDAIRQNKLVKMIGMKTILDQMDALPPGDEFDVDSILSIRGAAQVPSDMESIMMMGPDDDLPINFYVQIQFSNSKGVDKILSEIKDNARTTEKDGKTYYQPPEGFGPSNLYVHTVNDKTIEFGTTTYVFNANRNVASKSLAKIWNGMPKRAIRLAVDIESNRDLVDDLISMAEENEPEAAELFKLIDDVAQLSLAIDPNQQKMFEVQSKSLNSDSAKNLKSGLDGLLLMARAGGKEWLRQAPIQDEEFQSAFEELIDQLKAKQNSSTVAITVSKPKNFEKVTEVLLKEAKKSAEKINKMNEFRNIAIGVHTYYDSYKRMPFNVGDRGGLSKDLSWRCRVLPFVEANNVYDQMNMKEAWDSDTNKKWAEKMPEVFGKNGKTTRICWIKSDVTRFETIRDGTSNTIMFLENPKGVAWSKNADLSADDAVKLIKGLADGETLVAVFYDASTHQLDNSIDEDSLKALMTPNGEEIVRFDEKGKPKVEKFDK